MTPSDGLLLVLVLTVAIEALLVLAWLVEHITGGERRAMDADCPEGHGCRGHEAR